MGHTRSKKVGAKEKAERVKGCERPIRAARVVWIGSGLSEFRSAGPIEKNWLKRMKTCFFSLIQRRNVLDFSNKKHACYDIHEKQQEKFEDD